MKTLFRGLIIALSIGTAFAATAPSSVSWTRPVTYSDNSPLPLAAITGNKILCTFTPTGGAAAPCVLAASTTTGAAQTFTTTLTYPSAGGKACFQVIATAGVDSDPSTLTADSCATVPALKPSAPSNVVITVTIAMTLKSETPITVQVADPIVAKVEKP
jgi:hypothetical protein